MSSESTASAALTSESPDLPPRRAWLYTVLIAAVVFAAVAPTLRWTQLTGGNENIVIETALEIRRGECGWLLPTMLGEPRVKKPPLVAWIVAASLRDETIHALSDPARRERAYVDLAWQVRWSALLAGCGTILATFALARAVLNNRDAVIAAAVVGTLLMFQRYMRQSTTDVHLTLWVAVANAAMALGLLRGRWTIATLVAATALGIAFLCKGPVALVQTLAPALAFVTIRRFWLDTPNRSGDLPAAGTSKPFPPQGAGRERGAAASSQQSGSLVPPPPGEVRWGRADEKLQASAEPPSFSIESRSASAPPTLPSPSGGEGFGSSAPSEPFLRLMPARRLVILIFVGITIFTLIAAPWFVYVAANVPDVLRIWFVEVNREGATDLDVSNPLVYLLWIPLSWPWVVFLFVSGIVILQQFRRRPEWLLPALQVWVPLLIMVLFRDRKERYMLPLVAPLAVLSAIGVRAVLDAARDPHARALLRARIILGLHWFVLAAVAIAFPLAGMFLKEMRSVEGQPWFPPAVAVPAACGLALLIGAGILLRRSRPHAVVAVTFASVLVLQALLQHGYAQGTSGRSQLKLIADAILREVPDAEIYDYTENKRIDEETAIYLNRIIPQRDPFTLPPSDRPQVWITRQNKRAITAGQDPTPPPGWRLLIKVPERENVWWAFVRPPGG